MLLRRCGDGLAGGSRPLQAYLLALMLIALLPMLALGVLLAAWLASQQRQSLEGGLQATGKALALAIDREVAANIAALQALATTDTLTRGDMAGFYERALLAQWQHPYWNNVVLLDPTGQQLVNTAKPLGESLPHVGHQEFVRRTIDLRQPVVSDLDVGAVLRRPVIVVLVPVIQDDRMAYIIAAVVNPQTWSEMLADFHAGPGVVVAVVDGNNRIIARAPSAEKYLGLRISDQFTEAREQAPSSVIRGQVLEGHEVIGSFHPSRLGHWAVFAAIRTSATEAPITRTLWLTSGLVATIFLASIGVALFIARRIAEPVAELAAAGQRLAAQQPISQPRTIPITEIDHLWHVLAKASTELLRAVDEREEALRGYAAMQDAARRAAEKAHDAQSRFLAAASHDLRQPFQAMRLFYDVLTAKLTDPKLQIVTANLGIAMAVGEQLLSALLDISVLEARMVKATFERFQVDEILAPLVADFEAQARAKNIELRYVRSTAGVRSDRLLLARIVRNLMSNAFRFTDTGTVLLGCRRGEGLLRIELWDTGIGIAEDQRELVFENFYQVGNPARDRSQGLGLGLPIASRLAELLGHRISVRSSLGKGSVFAVSLPLAEPPHADT